MTLQANALAVTGIGRIGLGDIVIAKSLGCDFVLESGNGSNTNRYTESDTMGHDGCHFSGGTLTENGQAYTQSTMKRAQRDRFEGGDKLNSLHSRTSAF
jgi:hypothetical protein